MAIHSQLEIQRCCSPKTNMRSDARCVWCLICIWRRSCPDVSLWKARNIFRCNCCWNTHFESACIHTQSLDESDLHNDVTSCSDVGKLKRLNVIAFLFNQSSSLTLRLCRFECCPSIGSLSAISTYPFFASANFKCSQRTISGDWHCVHNIYREIMVISIVLLESCDRTIAGDLHANNESLKRKLFLRARSVATL